MNTFNQNEYNKKYYQENKERELARCKQYRNETRKEQLEKNKTPEVRQSKAKWARENRAKLKESDPIAYEELLQRQREDQKRSRLLKGDYIRQRDNAYRTKNKDRLNLASRLRKHGISVYKFEEMLKKQDNKCACCFVELKKDAWTSKSCSIDHCHSTGKIRGLLCQSCNIGIGHFSDSPEKLQQAANYLLRNL